MSDRVFRIYKIFAAVLCVCAFSLGGFLGLANREKDRRAADEATVLTAQKPTPETTQISIATTEQISLEEQIYREYFESSAYRGGTYTLSDLDDNGVPEMLIRPNEEVHEIVTIVDGEPAVVLSDYGLFLCEGNIIGQYGEGSGGCTVWYYEIKGAVAQPIVCVVWMFHEDAWYTSTDYSGSWDTMTPITEEEKNQIVSQYLPLEKNIPETGYLHFLYHDIVN